MIRNLAAFCCLGAVLATSAVAHDENLIPKVRQLGIAVGKAYVCTPLGDRDYARADFEEMFDTILKIDGHELAFVFAVGIGYGAATDQTGLDCKQLIERVNAVKAEMGLGVVK